jgi:hypothetical protein
MAKGKRGRAIDGTVVDNDDFDIRVGLRLDTGQSPADCLLGIEGRDDDADQRQSHFLLLTQMSVGQSPQSIFPL